MPASKAPPLDAVLIGYENQENLGLRSILAYLRHQGFRAALLPFRPGSEGELLKEIRAKRPRLVGFSLIFQYALDEFGSLMTTLRDAGVTAHFTAGGHFPSLAPEETLDLLPALDTVVRFEGELTLTELMAHLDAPETWGAIQGLAFRQDGRIVLTPPRPLIADLDSLPPVARDEPKEVGGGLLMASMLASRGCLYNCAFCSIRQFYGSSPGPLRRARSPQAVVDEMAGLYSASGVRVFLFQDDDFAARTPAQRAWVQAFMDALVTAGLVGDGQAKVGWKISCRVDEMAGLYNGSGVRVFLFQDDDFAARTPAQRAWVQAFMDALVAAGLVGDGQAKVGWKISCRVDDLATDILEAMLDHGLVGVYLGVESGSEQGLKVLNKRVTVDQNRQAIALLKAYDVAMSMGFMLFDPGSTVATLRENIRFLRETGADGHFPINFCKMLPYAGTPIEAELRSAGRLRGSTARPDYSFPDPRVDWYAFLVHRIFGRRNFGGDGLVFRLQQADADVRFQRALTDQPIPEGYEPALRDLIRRANVAAVETLSDLLDGVVEQGAEPLIDEEETLLALTDREWRAEAAIETELARLMLQAEVPAAERSFC